jgi:predicted RNA polymerase sigma factor
MSNSGSSSFHAVISRAASSGLAALEAIAGTQRSHLWHAALAGDLRRLGRMAEAAGELEIAASLAPAEGERLLLVSRLLGVRPGPA